MTPILALAIRRRSLVVLARIVHAVVLIGTSFYCLLIYSPFTYQQFIKPQVSAALAGLAMWHSAFYWLALALTLLTIAPFLERSRARVVGWIYLAGATMFGIWLSTHPILSQPDPARPNLVYALLALMLPVGLAVFDHVAAGPNAPFTPADDRRSSTACWITAACVWVVFSVGAIVRLRWTSGIELSSGALLLAIVVSAVAALTAFAFIWIALMTASAAASLTHAPGRVEYWILAALSAGATALAIARLVLAPISITGLAGALMGAGFGVAIAAVWSGIGRIRTSGMTRTNAVPTALDAWLAPIAMTRSRATAAAGAAAVAAIAWLVIARVSTFDWDFMIQKVAALAAWTGMFAFVHAASRERAGLRRIWTAPVAVLLLASVELVALPRVPAWFGAAGVNPEFALDGYAAVDPSYRLVRDALRPGNSDDAVAFYAYLRANTGRLDAPVGPAPIDFVREWRRAPAPKPHIFFFIVDSLRRDYVSTYNRAVSFTPDIEAFANDSYVFQRAFTRYGGTGLAVPSLWAGGLLFHKEYVTPFAPMNALQKLLDAEGYRQFIAADHITDQLFVPATGTVPLARNVAEMAHGFCPVVDEMMAAIDNRPADGRPIFGHARTLDLHIGNIWSAKVPSGESYPGFFGPYAARVRAIDTCFGRFVTYLKTSGLYDNSVIVFTSDHGDSLGEGGRWGHGTYVFPEIMHIPLIIHLPPSLRDREADLSRVSFGTDVTPTLYALLGEQPDALGTQFGAPLFAAPGTDVSARKRESFLVASSYGPTYGLIQDNGLSLYIADATYGRDYAFDLRDEAAGRRIQVTDAERAANRRRIRDEVAAIADRYHFTPQP